MVIGAIAGAVIGAVIAISVSFTLPPNDVAAGFILGTGCTYGGAAAGFMIGALLRKGK